MRGWPRYAVGCAVAAALCALAWASYVADLNGDDMVDYTDLAIFWQAWRDFRNGVPTWDRRADIYPIGAPDGTLDRQDVQTFLDCCLVGNRSAPDGLASPTESAPGVNPGILIDIYQTGQPPDPVRQVKGYIIYRGSAQYINVADPENIVQVLDQSFPGPWMDDQADLADVEFDKDWSYVGGTGDQEDASARIVYNRRALVPGDTYYYRIRRIVTPYQPQIPIYSTGGAGTAAVHAAAVHPAQITYVTATQTFTPNAAEVLGQPSSPLGPVTFILPAIPREPLNGSTTINPQEITFNWDLGTGPSEGNGAAARYVLVVFRADNLNDPIYQSTDRQPTSTTMSLTVNDPNGNFFQGGTEYVWAIGHYVQGEQRAKNTLQLIFSQQFHFATVNLPPSPSAASAAKGSTVRGPRGVRRGRQ